MPPISIRAKPFLAPIGDVIRHFGAVGTGTVFKLINNLMGAVQIASLAEGVAMAEQAGLDMKLVAEALGTGAVASPQVIRHSKRMVARDFSGASFTTALRHKDAVYAVSWPKACSPARRWSAMPRSKPMQRRRPRCPTKTKAGWSRSSRGRNSRRKAVSGIGWKGPSPRNRSASPQISAAMTAKKPRSTPATGRRSACSRSCGAGRSSSTG